MGDGIKAAQWGEDRAVFDEAMFPYLKQMFKAHVTKAIVRITHATFFGEMFCALVGEKHLELYW